MKQDIMMTTTAALLTGALLLPVTMGSAARADVTYGTHDADGVSIAYREAGDPSKPTVLLLHGFPTSSQMFSDLIPILDDDYHVIAPDYPGFGASDMPPADDYDYTFDNAAATVRSLLDAKGIELYTAYVMDYGAPVGYRLFAEKPEQVTGFVIQNGNAYEEGLTEFWDPFRGYWEEPAGENEAALRGFLTLEATKWQYTHGVQDPSKINPDNYWNVQYLLDRPGNQEVQLEYFYDYRTNLTHYPHWQDLFRQHQPPALIVWGENDAIFPPSGAHPYKRDLSDVEFHLLNTGHFALEDHAEVIGHKMLKFLERVAN
jgi:pimeloyl-ACP methyl ester carboxylesterase